MALHVKITHDGLDGQQLAIDPSTPRGHGHPQATRGRRTGSVHEEASIYRASTDPL